MPLKYHIIEHSKLVHVTGTGVVTFKELMGHLEELSRDPRYKPPMKKLVDYRNITLIELSPQEADIFSRRKAALAQSFEGEICAIVAPRDVNFGIARTHSALIESSNINTSVFRDFHDATKWLGITIEDE